MLAVAPSGSDGYGTSSHSRNQYPEHAVGCPCVVENVLARLVARDGVGNDGVIRTLVVGDGVSKIELGELVIDNTLAFSTKRTASQSISDSVGEADTLLCAAEEFVRLFLIPSVESKGGYRTHGFLKALALVVTMHIGLAKTHRLDGLHYGVDLWAEDFPQVPAVDDGYSTLPDKHFSHPRVHIGIDDVIGCSYA